MKVSDEGAVSRRCEEHQPEDDCQVGEPPGEKERVRGPNREPAVEDQSDGEQEERRSRARLGDRGNDAREERADEAHRDDRHPDGCLEGEHPRDGRRRSKGRKHGERKHRGSDGERRRAGDGDEAVHAHQDSRGHEPVDGKQRRHEREAACDDHRARILLPCTGGHEEDGRRHGDEGGHADAVEVHPHRRHEHDLAEDREEGDRHGRAAGDNGKRGNRNDLRSIRALSAYFCRG